MPMQKLTLIALVSPVLLIGGLWAARGNAQDARAIQSQETPGPRIASPENWVPFTAEWRRVKPRPNAESVVVVGRFSRASNGSTRLESGPESEPARVIDIKNIARRLYYTTARDANGNRYWVEQPLRLGPDGWKPMLMRERADRVVLKEPFDGRQVVSVVVGPGMVDLMAPALNFYPLVKTYIPTGDRTEAHVVSTDEPAGDLFEPPAGAEIRRSEKPAGIVVETREEAQARGVQFPIIKPEQQH